MDDGNFTILLLYVDKMIVAYKYIVAALKACLLGI